MNSKDKVLMYNEAGETEARRPRWLSKFRGRGADTQAESPVGSARTATNSTNGSAPQVELTDTPTTDAPSSESESTPGGFDSDVGLLRREALDNARIDAEVGLPAVGSTQPSDSEVELTEKCLGLFAVRRAAARGDIEERWADEEKEVAEKLGRARLLVDRMQRLTREVKRLKARTSLRRQEVVRELQRSENDEGRGLSTRAYLAAVSFLALVEYFANGPIFASLLPRDPLTERQIRILSEISQGWMAGLQRVFAQLVLRPDAALLALGVVVFLCVLGHFFGRALRDLVTHREQRLRRDTVTGRSPLEHAVPLVLTGIGLVLVIGVLFEARVTLGEVGEQRYVDDMSIVEELRRDAGWMRVDGDLVGANERADRADDMEGAATELKEYSLSMSLLSFPILLLNLTLVLCSICAAYYHRQVTRWEYFDDTKFEDERRQFVDAAEAASEEVTGLLSDATKHLRDLRGMLAANGHRQLAGVAQRLGGVIELYRSENLRVRGLDPEQIPALSGTVALEVDVAGADASELGLHTPEEYQADLSAMRDRLYIARSEFNAEAI